MIASSFAVSPSARESSKPDPSALGRSHRVFTQCGMKTPRCPIGGLGGVYSAMVSEDERKARCLADLERRRHFRVDVDIEAVYRTPDAEKDRSAHVVKLGLGGARILLDHELPVGCRLDLVLPPGAGDHTSDVRLPAQIAWSTEEPTGGGFQIGMKFLDLNERAKAGLVDRIVAAMG